MNSGPLLHLQGFHSVATWSSDVLSKRILDDIFLCLLGAALVYSGLLFSHPSFDWRWTVFAASSATATSVMAQWSHGPPSVPDRRRSINLLNLRVMTQWEKSLSTEGRTTEGSREVELYVQRLIPHSSLPVEKKLSCREGPRKLRLRQSFSSGSLQQHNRGRQE